MLGATTRVLVQLDSAKLVPHETVVTGFIPKSARSMATKKSAKNPQAGAMKSVAARTVVLTNNTQPVPSLAGLE